MSGFVINYVGLQTQDDECLVKKHLLQMPFLISVFFDLCIKPKVDQKVKLNVSSVRLFPDISTSEFHNLTNTARGRAMVCAADDLELSLNGENGQIEIFNSAGPSPFSHFQDKGIDIHPSKNRFVLDDDPQYELPGSLDSSVCSRYPSIIGDSFSTNPLHHRQSTIVNIGLNHGNFSHINAGMPISPEQPNPPAMMHPGFPSEFVFAHQSHFAMNAFGMPPNTVFTDFQSSSATENSSYESSLEAYDSPLDDMFLSRPSVVRYDEDFSSYRKRKPESPPSLGYDNVVRNADVVLGNFGFQSHAHKKVKTEQQPCVFQQASLVRPPVDAATLYGPQIENEILVQDMFTPMMKDDHNEKSRFACTECDAVFKVKSYLTRHLRKHNNANAFVCPFYKEHDQEYNESGKAGTKCHPTGGFSRKDTYKTHLKAIHFIYPPRTKSRERNTLGGRCAGCFEFFDTNADWFKNHIEEGLCRGFSKNTGAKSSADVKVKVKEETD